jgi:tricorn protease
VVVVPLASEHAVRYYDLTARQRAAVCEASGGRLGYLKIPDMMARGWADFHRDLYTEFQRDGLIVDLRDTQGGDAGQLVAEKLARRIIGWNLSRYEEPLSYPVDAPRGPIVAITDGYASSGGDLVIQALKAHRIATVVGTRTWGGVRGVDFKYDLVDGTIAAQPKYAWWFADGGWTAENHGVDPDVEVTMAPHDWAAGRDPQLDTAVRLALRALAEQAPAAPPAVPVASGRRGR